MTQRRYISRLSAFCAITLCACISLCSTTCFGQGHNGTSKALPSFTAASIKPFTLSSHTPPVHWGYPQVHIPGLPLAGFIRFAFHTATPIAGVPDWAKRTRYDIDASVPASVGKLPPNQRQQVISLMMRSLLIHRFGLKYHETTRKGHIYWLTVDGTEPKFLLPGASTSQPSWEGSADFRANQKKITMRQFSKFLSGFLQKPVLDKTNLPGRYNFELRWNGMYGEPNRMITKGYPLPEALEKELGLKLTKHPGMVPLIVVDHIQKPTRN